jgi:hypothetical protein
MIVITNGHYLMLIIIMKHLDMRPKKINKIQSRENIIIIMKHLLMKPKKFNKIQSRENTKY